jgi:FkbM family methyltransferase
MRLIPHRTKYKIVSKWYRKYPPFDLVKKGDSIIQAGASGRLCELGRSQPVICSTLVGKGGEINVFEVLPENVEGLKLYVEQNGIRNIRCHNIGIWNKPDVVEFSSPYRMSTGSIIKKVRPEMENKFETSRSFNVDSIDNLVKDRGIKKVNMLNITINGAEPEAIEGARNTIMEYKPLICMPYPERNDDKVKSELEKMGYKIFEAYMRLYFISVKFKILWAGHNI